MANKTKIAIVCQNDALWSLYAWNKALPLLCKTSAELEITGFWVCNEKFMNVPATKVFTWYYKVFGAMNFIMLALFKISFQLISFIKSITSGYKTSFTSLCHFHKIPHYTTSSPNDTEFTTWVKNNNIDILVIMVGHILKGDILNAPANCIINKHAAMLPSNKGVFPYFWAYMNDEQQGISFHKVTNKIDDGDILYQEELGDKKWLSSMIVFYFFTYKNYGRMLMEAIKNAKNKTSVTPGKTLKPSYHGGPTASDHKKFRSKGGKIIRFSDLFLPFSL